MLSIKLFVAKAVLFCSRTNRVQSERSGSNAPALEVTFGFAGTHRTR